METNIFEIACSFIFRTAHASGVRTYNDIVNSGAYAPADYQPRPISMSDK
jgi:hypothetical protein